MADDGMKVAPVNDTRGGAHSPTEDGFVEKQMRDIGADLYFEIQQYSQEELDAERKTVLKKIDWVIMPIVCPVQPCPTLKGRCMLIVADMHNLHNPVPRQTQPQLRKRLHAHPRFGTPRATILLGRRDFQLRVLILGDTGKSIDSTLARIQVHWVHDLDLVNPPMLPCRR